MKFTNKIKIAAITLAFAVAGQSQAQDFSHQINASGTEGAFDFGIGDGDDAVFALTGDYRLGLDDMFQIAAQLSYASTSGANSFSIAPGVVVNFMDNLQNSAFVGAYYVFTRVKVDGFSAITLNQAKLTAGKRFEIISNVSYEPYVYYTYGFGDEFTADRNDLGVTFLSFTVTF